MPTSHHAVANAAARDNFLQIRNVLDRAAYGPAAHIGPRAKACLLVEPTSASITWEGLFAAGWKSVEGHDIYNLFVANTHLHISLEQGVWMIEATFPVDRRPPTVLGLGCSLIVTRSPMAAAHLAGLCVPKPLSPFEWLPYG